MSPATWCRLCANICNDYISLCDESGRCNVYLYEITVKYFHPMILSLIDPSQRTVMCMECWHHIFEFNNFQKAIIKAQSKLAEGSVTHALNTEVVLRAEDPDVVDVKEDLQFMDDSDSNGIDYDNSTLHGREVAFGCTSHDADDNFSCHDNDSLHEEYDDPVGHFEGGEFNGNVVNMPASPSQLEVIVLDSDDEWQWDVKEEAKYRNNDSTNFTTKKPRIGIPRQPVDNYIAKWRPTLDCPICNEPFLNMAFLGEHFSRKHSQERCYIVCCQLKFYSRCTIAEHARSHIEPNDNECELCGETFESKTLLRQHNAGLVQHQRRKRPRNSMAV